MAPEKHAWACLLIVSFRKKALKLTVSRLTDH